ncbi:MAG: sulfatase, partial [Candidatus Aminicenantes bacterium]|nr:sulfatase [Candidatus Aminicenantes bacterium]
MKNLKAFRNMIWTGALGKSLPLLLLIPLLFTYCAEKQEKLTPFFPDTIDGVTSFIFNSHSMEDHFSGNWGPPVISVDKKFSRELKEGEGRLLFDTLRSERYIFNVNIHSSGNPLSIGLNGKKYKLTGKNKFFGKESIKKGDNKITFQFAPGIKFKNADIFPSRIARIKNFKDLIRDPRVLFLPGVIRYYINPFAGEELILSLDLNGNKSTSLKVEVITGGEKHTFSKKVHNLKRFRISLKNGEFQEIRITPSGINTEYLRIAESFLVSDKPELNKGSEEIPGSMNGKNLLFVLLDAARNDHMSYNGHSRETTPNIDSFSEGSFIFRNCYSEASFTLASTGTLITGLPPDFHGVISKHYSSLNMKSITLAKLFGIRGYFTGSITGNPNYGKAFNYHIGFTDFIELFEDHPVVDAGEFIEPFKKMIEKTKDSPFFIYLHIREPHDPFIMPPPFLGKFQNKFKKNGKELKKFGKAFGQSYIDEGPETELLKKIYDENLAYGDMIFGKIVSILKEKGLLEDTLVVFLSDHGEAIGENGNIGHGHVLYQPGIRIPIVMKIPGMKGGKNDQQVITSDLVRTITEMF